MGSRGYRIACGSLGLGINGQRRRNTSSGSIRTGIEIFREFFALRGHGALDALLSRSWGVVLMTRVLVWVRGGMMVGLGRKGIGTDASLSRLHLDEAQRTQGQARDGRRRPSLGAITTGLGVSCVATGS